MIAYFVCSPNKQNYEYIHYNEILQMARQKDERENSRYYVPDDWTLNAARVWQGMQLTAAAET